MSLHSLLTVPPEAGTCFLTHQPITSHFKLNSNFKFTCKPQRLKSSSIISQIACSNAKTETVDTNPSVTGQVELIDLENLDTKTSFNDAQDLHQGLSQYESKWVNPSNPRISVLPRQRLRYSKNHTWSPKIAALRALAKKLDFCEPSKDIIFEVLDSFEETLNPSDALVVMNNIYGWETAYYFFQWLNKKKDFQMDTVTYNVTIKVLRRGRQWDKVEELLQNMQDQGIMLDNITCSTVISCARLCNLPHKAVEWFERMNESQCVPDEVTFTSMIDAYGRAGKLREALNLYERARTDGWRPDMKAFCTLLKCFSVSGDFDSALNTFHEMKALGVRPNLVAYNIMFNMLAKIGKPSVAKSLFNEMITMGLSPNRITLISLIRVYSKSRWAVDTLKVWNKMKEKGWSKGLSVNNTLLSMFADLGCVKEAVTLFKEMRQSDDCKPDSWSYTSMITLYTRREEIEEANRMFNEMKEAGFRPSLMVYTCLIQCYGKSKRFDEFVKTFNVLLDEGIIPDDKFCSSLLWILTLCEKEETGKVVECIQNVNPKLGLLVKMLQEEDMNLPVFQEELQIFLKQASKTVQRSFCNSLIDLCHNFNFRERALNLLYLGMRFGLYQNLHTKSPTEWCLDLRSLSFKAAITAFDDWVSNLSKAKKSGEEMPPSLGIQTGRGGHTNSPEQALVALFESHLREIEFPFEKSTTRIGWFFTTRDAAISWLQSRSSWPDDPLL
ncbi:pentatricopeptide repeat-containing protein At5g46580, chloroplastic [Cryptomeria japonica]|uniref:pentatricopeptide repeat-containing protein At5g46580, chloroplastic n=1 Tax=Cryptomeria japonica TaxID=3369 RepID=UPI0027DAA645|nr:pentatricopeptide repeat-containing protein At5g46580, chloroplastic [Cryptomeria japonica]